MATPTTLLLAIDNHHFYRASNFFFIFNEARLERTGLTSFDATIAYGSTHSARTDCADLCGLKCKDNSCNKRKIVDLFQIYGAQNIQALSKGVPGKDLSNPADLALTNLSLVNGDNCFGQLAYQGKFSLLEANFFYTQNICNGFFWQAHVPLRRMVIDDIRCCDLTDGAACEKANNPEWQTVLNLFCSILDKYCLKLEEIKQTGIGDASFLAGWTHSYQNTEILDFVDTTVRVGILLPTGKKRDPDSIFDIPLGYNGHFGVPIAFDFALGALDWTTFGFHLGALLFADATRTVRVKTDLSQTGLIKLAKAKAKIEKGLIWDISAYFKADHFAKGLSLLFGYTFARKRGDTIKEFDCRYNDETCKNNACFVNPCCVDPCIASTDCAWRGWHMHTLHFIVEYDFAKEGCFFGPRISFFYNKQFGGNRVFKTDMVGSNLGLDITWGF